MNISNTQFIDYLGHLGVSLDGLTSMMGNLTSVPVKRKMIFADLEPGDTLFEVVESKVSVEIVERKVLGVGHTGKKTHFTLEPKEGLLDSGYYPYSNKNWTMSKKFNPIFIKRNDAIGWIYNKLNDDENYLETKRDLVRRKKTIVRNMAGLWSDYNMHQAYVNSILQGTSTFSPRYTTYIDPATLM